MLFICEIYYVNYIREFRLFNYLDAILFFSYRELSKLGKLPHFEIDIK